MKPLPPVARLESMRIMAALSTQYNIIAHQVDITSAYLNGHLDEGILMEVSSHISAPLELLIEKKKCRKIKAKALEMRRALKHGNKVCLMRRDLYGLRQYSYRLA